MKIKKSPGGAYRFLGGVIFELMLLLLVSFIAALIANASEDPTSKIGSLSLISLLISAGVSSIALSRLSGEAGVKVAAVTSLTVTLIMMLIGLISTGGRLTGGSFMNYGCYLGASLLFAYLGRKREKRHKRRHR